MICTNAGLTSEPRTLPIPTSNWCTDTASLQEPTSHCCTVENSDLVRQEAGGQIILYNFPRVCGCDKHHVDLTASYHQIPSKVLHMYCLILSLPNQMNVSMLEDYGGLIWKQSGVSSAGKQALSRNLHFCTDCVVTMKKGLSALTAPVLLLHLF